jgi:hypothetical protein
MEMETMEMTAQEMKIKKEILQMKIKKVEMKKPINYVLEKEQEYEVA